MRISMPMVCGFPLLALLLAGSAPLMGQGGSVQGTLLDNRGFPLVHTTVTATRKAPPLSQTAESGPDGSFTVQGLPAGTYALCVQVHGGKHLDPCEWNAPGADVVTLAAGQNLTGNRLQLKKASKLQIRIEDPNQHLSPRSHAGEPPQIAMGVLTPAGITSAPVLVSTDKRGRTYEISVAFDLPLTFTISGKHLEMTDERGAHAEGGSAASFQHVSDAPTQKSFTFTVLKRTD